MAELKVHRSRSNPLLSGLDTGKKRTKSEPASIAAWQVGWPTAAGRRRRRLPNCNAGAALCIRLALRAAAADDDSRHETKHFLA